MVEQNWKLWKFMYIVTSWLSFSKGTNGNGTATEQQWNISKFSYGNPLISEPMGFSNHQSSWMEISRDTWGWRISDDRGMMFYDFSYRGYTNSGDPWTLKFYLFNETKRGVKMIPNQGLLATWHTSPGFNLRWFFSPSRSTGTLWRHGKSTICGWLFH